MFKKIHTIEANGLTISRVTDGYTEYRYAALKSGRKVEAVRAELERIAANSSVKASKRFVDAGIEAPDYSSIDRAAKKAVKFLAAIADVPAGTFVWEKVSWHADFELALRAAKGNRSLVKSVQIEDKI